MKKPKIQYNVYLVGKGFGCYKKDYCNVLLGKTYAVSEKQAINNVRYNTRNKERPNGGYSSWELGDIREEGHVEFYYKAIASWKDSAK